MMPGTRDVPVRVRIDGADADAAEIAEARPKPKHQAARRPQPPYTLHTIMKEARRLELERAKGFEPSTLTLAT